tara:strand:+ start:168 stop:371 length:204 start_codon:yes stop_codon:yes gene_type:complete
MPVAHLYLVKLLWVALSTSLLLAAVEVVVIIVLEAVVLGVTKLVLGLVFPLLGIPLQLVLGARVMPP